MAIVKFDESELIALTVENKEVCIWKPQFSINSQDKTRVFQGQRGKYLLVSDQGFWWKNQKILANGTKAGQFWLGDFPYGSYAWSVAQFPTGKISVTIICTDIDPSGLSSSDKWWQKVGGMFDA